MSIDPHDNDDDREPSQKVTDEEGTVDQQVKNRILKARQRVDEAESELFVNAPTSGVDVSPQEQHVGFVTMVQQYIRSIKPLLTSEKVPRAEYYHDDVLLFKKEVPPPNGRYEWSRFAREGIENTKIKRDMGLPSHFDPPKSKTVAVQGLAEILILTAIST